MRHAASYAPHAQRQAQGTLSVAVRRVDRRSDEVGPLVQPRGRTDLASSMLGWPAHRARGAFGCMDPLPRAGRHRRGTRLGEVLVVQLTNFSALSLFGSRHIARSDARVSSVTSFASLVLACRFVRCNHRRLQATKRLQVLEVSLEVLSEMIGALS